jgi:predicted peptidase
MASFHFKSSVMHFVFIILLLSGIQAIAQDFDRYEKRTFASSTGFALPYRILFPENYDRTKTYPLVLFLHGAGERGDDNEKQLVHGARLFLKEENRKNFPAIVIFPQCPADSYWAQVKINRATSPFTIVFDYDVGITPPLKAAIELVRHIASTEKVNKKQIYITGLSMGGMGTFEAVYRYPKLFAAAMPVCGGGDTNKYTKRIGRLPFWIFHGSADAVVDVNLSRQMVEKLKSLKVPVTYTEYEGVNHNSWDNAFAEPEFMRWMFSKKR